jgi:hypothetical protein
MGSGVNCFVLRSFLRGLCRDGSSAAQVNDFQFFTRYTAVRQASACAVSVGLRAPLVPITEGREYQIRSLMQKAQRFTTFRAGIVAHAGAPVRVGSERGNWAKNESGRHTALAP